MCSKSTSTNTSIGDSDDGKATSVPAASDDPDTEVAPENPAAPPLDYEQYFRALRPLLASYAHRIADDAQQGEDAVQEAMIEAYARWAEVSVMANPRGWMLKVISRKLFHLRRRRLRDERLPPSSIPVPGCTSKLADESGIWEATGRLPRRQREIVALRFELGCEIDEIARVLDIKESTVRGTLTRAKQRLKVLLAAAREEDER